MQIVSAQPKQSSGSQNANPQQQSTAISAELIDRLFKGMGNAYGALMLDRWKDCDLADVKALWLRQLSRHTVAQFAEASKQMLTVCPFPPTLPEFDALCVAAGKKGITIAAHRPAVLTLPSRDTPDAIAEARARCMETAARLGMVHIMPPTE